MSVRKTVFVFMLLLWFSLIGQTAAAEETCSITLTFSYRGASVTGGSIALYNVTGLATDTTAQTAQTLAGQTAGLGGTTMPIEEGHVLFDRLTPGLYLLTQEKSTPGFQPIRPFLVCLPMEQDGTLIQNVSAAPKMAPYPASPETGQPPWPFAMFWTSGAVLLLAGIGRLTFFRAKNRLR